MFLFVVFSYSGQLLCDSGCRFLIFTSAVVCFWLSFSHIWVMWCVLLFVVFSYLGELVCASVCRFLKFR